MGRVDPSVLPGLADPLTRSKAHYMEIDDREITELVG